MLSQLSVKNFALIEKVKLDLNDGFTVITGETGSGKSILLGALKLIMGERADYSVIREETEKTIVEAVFKLSKDKYLPFFNLNDLDFEEDTIIRREINTNGKSRAFINDTPVQLLVLKQLTENLVHIHSQHHTLELRNKQFQLSILDAIAENGSLLLEMKEVYASIKQIEREIKELKEKQSKQELESDFNNFQLEELLNLQLDKLNYSEIEQEVERGEQFEEIKAAYQLITSSIGEDEGTISQLNRILQFIKVSDTKIGALMERIKSVVIELQDIEATAEDDLADLSYEPEELSRYIIKLDAYNTALRKHNLSSQEDLLQLFNHLSEEIYEADQIEELIEAKTKKLIESKEKASFLAHKLSDNRKKSAKSIESQVKELLASLKLEGAAISFDFKTKDIGETGMDDVVLYFSPNKGISPQVIEKSASGGELSRLMLAIQFLLSQKQQLPTVIFDEIDTGVSGEVAQKIGEHLKKMGERMQLLAITHLPQVASKGKHHILVRKSEESGMTKTHLEILDEEQRVEEIAKLMSGSKINEAAMLNAKNLMNE